MSIFEINHRPPDEAEPVERTRTRLSQIGLPPSLDPLPERSRTALDEPPLERFDRHPEDPPGAYEAAAREVCEPETVRAAWARAGTAGQASPLEEVEPHADRALEGVAAVRVGAITGPARSEAGRLLRIVETTESDVERIHADGEADHAQAEDLEVFAVPQAQEALAAATRRREHAEEALDQEQEDVENARSRFLQSATKPRELLQSVALPLWWAVLLAVADIAVTTVVTAPYVSNLIPTTFAGESYLIAGGMSLALVAASALAGVALAAIRLPGRLVAAMMVGVFGLIVWQLVVDLNALREGSQSGVLTLTMVSLAACYVAALVAYASAVWHDDRVRRELEADAGTTLGDALDRRAAASVRLSAAEAREGAAEDRLTQTWERIHGLRDTAARADAAGLQRRSDGVGAQVDAATCDAVASTAVNQEIAAHRLWAKSMFVMSHIKAQRELFPRGDDIRPAPAWPAGPPPRDDGLNTLQKLAIATLVAGAVGGLLFGPVIAAAASGLAAILLLASIHPRLRGHGASGPPAPAGAKPAPPPLGSPASDEDPLYYRQPDRMRARYGDGGAGVGVPQ